MPWGWGAKRGWLTPPRSPSQIPTELRRYDRPLPLTGQGPIHTWAMSPEAYHDLRPSTWGQGLVLHDTPYQVIPRPRPPKGGSNKQRRLGYGPRTPFVVPTLNSVHPGVDHCISSRTSTMGGCSTIGRGRAARSALCARRTWGNGCNAGAMRPPFHWPCLNARRTGSTQLHVWGRDWYIHGTRCQEHTNDFAPNTGPNNVGAGIGIYYSHER
jgi:hypothetical protein